MQKNDSLQIFMMYYGCDIDTHPFEREVLQVPQCDKIEKSVLHLGLYKYVTDGLQAIFPNINNFENFPWFGLSSF
jgi:hypothetical protein